QAFFVAHHDRFTDRAVLVLLELQLAEIVIWPLAAVGPNTLEILPKTEGPMPCCRSRDTGARGNALQAWMAQDGNRASCHHGECLHVHGEAVNLYAVDLATGERARQSVDADIFRLDVAGSLIELAIQAGYFDLAAFG